MITRHQSCSKTVLLIAFINFNGSKLELNKFNVRVEKIRYGSVFTAN